jgi:hypothetical protein
VVLYLNPCIRVHVILHGCFVTCFVLFEYDFVNERGIYGTLLKHLEERWRGFQGHLSSIFVVVVLVVEVTS